MQYILPMAANVHPLSVWFECAEAAKERQVAEKFTKYYTVSIDNVDFIGIPELKQSGVNSFLICLIPFLLELYKFSNGILSSKQL